jgi:hypothetical protein
MTPMAFRPYDGEYLPHGGVDDLTDNRNDEPPRNGVAAKERPMDAVRLDNEAAGSGLSERDRQILEFERQWWKYAGAKEQAIRDLFDMSATRYYQIINSLIDNPEALAFDPMLVKRLRRMRAARQRARSARRLGVEVTGR